MRQFLALDLPQEMREAIAALQSDLKGECPGWRWLPPRGIHLTLRFLGEVGQQRDRQAREAWSRAAAAIAPFRFRLSGIGRFPSGGRPRVLWVGVDETSGGGSLPELHRGLEQAAREVGFEPERRPFRPHLTVARAARSGRPVAPGEAVFESAIEIEAREVVLFRSDLEPAGARYTALAGFALAARR